MSGSAIVTTDESARTTPTATASRTAGVRTSRLRLVVRIGARAWRSESPGALGRCVPSGRPLQVELEARDSSGVGDQGAQRSQISPPRPAVLAELAGDSFRLGFPLALLTALTDLVQILVIRVHDAS